MRGARVSHIMGDARTCGLARVHPEEHALSAPSDVHPSALRALRRFALRAGLFCGLLWCCSARAEATLQVQPGVTCLSHGTLEAALVEAMAGTPTPDGVQVRVLGSEHDPRNVIMHIRYPDGTTVVRAFNPAPERCPHLHEAVALSLAFTLKASPTAARPAPERRAEQPVAARAPRELALGVDALLVPGLFGSLSGGGQLHGALYRGWFGVRAGVLGLRSSEQAMPSVGSYHVALVAARLDLCARLGDPDRFSAALCAGPQAGVHVIRGRGLDRVNDARLRFLGLSVGLELVQALGKHFALRGGLALLTNLQPVTVVARERDERIADRERLGRMGASLFLGLDYRFR